MVGGWHLLPLIFTHPRTLGAVASPFLLIGTAWGFTWAPVGWLAVGIVVSRPGGSPGNEAARTVLLAALLSLMLEIRWGLVPLWPTFFAPLAPALLLLIVRWPASYLFPRTSRLAAALVVGVVASGVGYNWYRFEYARRTPRVSSPRGTLRAPEADDMQQVVDYVRRNTTAADFVAVVPEERFINFFAERRHPTRDPGVGPYWLATDKDRLQFLAELIERPPAFVVLSRRTYREFGAGRFDEYEPAITAWIRSRYRPVLENKQYTVFGDRRMAHDGS